MKPANMVLDLLRTYKSRGTSARNIMAAGELFGMSENLTRVTLSRLVRKMLVEKVARGHYRLAQTSDPVSDFVEEWRLGEARLRPWRQATYLVAHLAQYTEKDQWVLNACGFEPLQDGLWARPDNLIRTGSSLEQWLTAIGLSQNTIIIEGGVMSSQHETFLLHHYDTKKLLAGYVSMTSRLANSATSLGQLSQHQAMATSFQLGGEAIQLLAKDPYLPPELMSSSEREELWQTMMDYDALGRDIWAESPTTMPAALASYA